MGFEFEVINPEDENYANVDAALGESTERFDYNGFVEAYNGLKVGAIPHFKFNRERLSGFKKQMERRGLQINVDYTANVNAIEEATEENPNPEEHIFVKRLTAKKGELIEPKRAGRKPADEKADGKPAEAGKPADAGKGKPADTKKGGKK